MSIYINRHVASNLYLYKQICSMKTMYIIVIVCTCIHKNTCCRIIYMYICHSWCSKILYKNSNCLCKNNKNLKKWIHVCTATVVYMNLHTEYMCKASNWVQREHGNLTSTFGIFAHYMLVMRHGTCLSHTHTCLILSFHIVEYHSTSLDISLWIFIFIQWWKWNIFMIYLWYFYPHKTACKQYF